MAILSISRDWGVEPSIVRVTTTDSLAAITAPGYLTSQASVIAALQNGAFQWADGDLIAIDYSDGESLFTRDAITNAFVPIAGGSGGGSITVPTLTDHIIVALDNVGTIGNILTNQNKTAIFNGVIQSGLEAPGNPGGFNVYSSSGAPGGYLSLHCNQNIGGSNVSIENKAHAASASYLIPDCGAISADFIVSNFPGTQHIESGSFQIDAGNLIATGDIIAQIATPATGSLRLRHISSGGDFFVIIQNKIMSQNTTYTIPDISGSQGAFVVSPVPYTMKSVTTTVAGDDPISNIADAFCLPTSKIHVTFQLQTFDASLIRVTPDAGTFSVVTSIAPGASTLCYTIINEQSF